MTTFVPLQTFVTYQLYVSDIIFLQRTWKRFFEIYRIEHCLANLRTLINSLNSCIHTHTHTHKYIYKTNLSCVIMSSITFIHICSACNTSSGLLIEHCMHSVCTYYTVTVLSCVRKVPFRFWRSGDCASWKILIIKPNRCINFSNLFLE